MSGLGCPLKYVKTRMSSKKYARNRVLPKIMAGLGCPLKYVRTRESQNISLKTPESVEKKVCSNKQNYVILRKIRYCKYFFIS